MGFLLAKECSLVLAPAGESPKQLGWYLPILAVSDGLLLAQQEKRAVRQYHKIPRKVRLQASFYMNLQLPRYPEHYQGNHIERPYPIDPEYLG
jgi:hypothetical protein